MLSHHCSKVEHMKRIALALLAFSTSAHAAQCLTYSGEVTLRGQLSHQTFPEQPNYESIAKGDAPATYFFVAPSKPVCVAEGESDDGLEPAEPSVEQVQLVFSGVKDSYGPLRPSLGKDVVCHGHLFHAITGHHHSPVLISHAVCSAAPADTEKTR
jgi:Domain of unknown function (DUF4431)